MCVFSLLLHRRYPKHGLSLLAPAPCHRERHVLHVVVPEENAFEVVDDHVDRAVGSMQCGSDLIDEELKKNDRPIFLYGLSAGGMETYHVAAKNRSDKIKGIIGMTFA